MGDKISEFETYRLNEPKAVSETLDGEAIAINLETGSYYSMNPPGSAFWELILSGCSVRQIVDSAEQRYDADRETLGKSIGEFLQLLIHANLIVSSGEFEADKPIALHSSKEAYVAPTIEQYDDMQEMLLADPIHDVEAAGWPHLK